MTSLQKKISDEILKKIKLNFIFNLILLLFEYSVARIFKKEYILKINKLSEYFTKKRKKTKKENRNINNMMNDSQTWCLLFYDIYFCKNGSSKTIFLVGGHSQLSRDKKPQHKHSTNLNELKAKTKKPL